MKNFTLNRQISLLVTGVVIAFTAVLWASLFAISAKSNERAASESMRLMEGRITDLQDQLSLIASDYNNWTDVYLAAREHDFYSLSSNYGITAERGDVFQFAQIFGGPFSAPISWRAGQGFAPQHGFLDTETIALLNSVIVTLNPEKRETFNYFSIVSGDLVTFSASYLLPESKDLLHSLSIADDAAIAVIGKIIEPTDLNRIVEELNVANLRVTEGEVAEGVAALPFLGVDGSPVARLVWQPSSPGFDMMMSLIPLMAVVNLSFVGAAILAGRMLSRNAWGLMEREIATARQARIDNLTGMPNRLSLLEHLTEISSQEHLDFAVVALDLDRFKQINDSVGHHAGDRFLVEFAKKLDQLSEPGVFVSRSGGDEFFVVVHSERNIGPLVANTVRVLESLSMTKIDCGCASFEILASKGLAHSGSNRDPKEIMRRADRAMYDAKRNKEQCVIHYSERLADEDDRRQDVARALRKSGFGDSEFRLVYQPIVSAHAPDSPVWYEALLRWDCPDLGSVSPEDVLRVAEATGQVVSLGWIIFDIVCGDLLSHPGLQASINISPAQVLHPGFTSGFLERLENLKLNPRRLQIEITENVAFECDNVVARELWRLHEAGVSIALDDFGKGFSSIGYLAKMPFDVLKIDKDFVMTESNQTSGLSIVKSIIGIGQALGLEVVAEGVEDAEMAHALKKMGCSHLQGFYIGRPAPLESFGDLSMTRLGVLSDSLTRVGGQCSSTRRTVIRPSLREELRLKMDGAAKNPGLRCR